VIHRNIGFETCVIILMRVTWMAIKKMDGRSDGSTTN
jgi:hypothetical protein